MKKVLLSALLALTLVSCNTSETKDDTTKEEEMVYKYGQDEILQDYLEDEVIYNETVCLVQQDDGTISGNLLYSPDKIIAVKDYSLENDFKDSEYEIDGNKIIRTSNSTIPYMTKENVKGLNFDESYGISTMNGKESDTTVAFTEGPGIVMHQINVTYSHKDKWTLEKPIYKGDQVPNVISKFKNKEHVTIGFYGDSIMTGCNCSSKLSIQPYLDDFPTLAVDGLKKEYGYEDIEMFNTSKGGMLSDWGVTNVDSNVNSYDPDLVFIGFGMNDGSWNVKPTTFVSNIETIVNKIQLHNPNAECVLVATILANPDAMQSMGQENYLKPLEELANSYDGVALMDMTTYSKNLLSKKKSLDMYANNVNHPSDFLVRGYASNILKLLVESYR